MVERLRQEIEGARSKPWEMPVNQMGGPHLEMPNLVLLTPFQTVSDYENYPARLQLPPLRSSDPEHQQACEMV